jgi:aspartyl-tRNA(Asn)/glutamyl-tRNA(Gln) amidotransferase subunit A
MTAEPETAGEMAAAVAARDVSPVQLVERALRRLEEWNPHVNAFSQVFGDEALEAARAAEAHRGDGRDSPGPLHGVPVAVKDLFDVAGHETTGCSRAFAGNVARDDAELVRRLRSAGAILVGKTNQHELACGATNLVSACGPTRNPWDPARITGGSSGGSGAAVAARVVPLALGSDTGGSIRMPSSLCGCWGLKPTYGRLPTHGMMPLAPSLDCPGPMAASASDLELWWRAMAFDRPAREAAGPAAPPEPPGRVGIPGDWFAEWSHPETWAAVEATGRALEELGLDVVAVGGRGIEDVREVWVDVGWAEFADAYPSLLERQDELLPPTAANLRHGAELSPGRREAARRRAGEIGAWFDERLSAVDLLLFPATPIAAPLADGRRVEVAGGRMLDWRREGGLAWFTEPVNLAGLPSLAVPAGHSDEGLPLGVQLVGRRGSDEWLMALGVRLEAQDERFRTRVPALPRG